MSGSPFPEPVHRAARWLMVVRSLSSRKAAETLAELFPGQHTPDFRTLALWRQDMDGLRQEEEAAIAEAERELAIRADQLIFRYLDILAEADDATVLKHGMTLNALAGTPRDKMIARQKIDSLRDSPNTVIPIQIIVDSTPPGITPALPELPTPSEKALVFDFRHPEPQPPEEPTSEPTPVVEYTPEQQDDEPEPSIVDYILERGPPTTKRWGEDTDN